MDRLEFTIFQKRLELARAEFPILHYLETETDVTLMFRTKDGWKYYTIVTDKQITEFAESEGYELEEAINLFKSQYCSNAVPLTNKELEYLNELYPEIETEPVAEIGSVSKRTDILDNEDIVIEAEDYSEFLLKLFDGFEKKVLKAVEKIQTDKTYTKKSIGDFLKDLFNSVNTIAFMKQVTKYIKLDMLKGLASAEEELNMDIGFTGNFEQKLKQLQAQQIDGYTINGKKWHGIRGVTKEIQSKVIASVQNNIKENNSLEKMKEDIKKEFAGFSDYRSNMIARTETTNIINEGNLLGYKESGLDGKKKWNAALDNRTSDICKRLNNMQVELDDYFIDPETRKAYFRPTAHVNCRCRLTFSPK